MVAEDTVPTEKEPQTFNKAWNHPDLETQKMARGHKEGIQ